MLYNIIILESSISFHCNHMIVWLWLHYVTCDHNIMINPNPKKKRNKNEKKIKKKKK